MPETAALRPVAVPRWTFLPMLAAALVIGVVTLDNGLLLGDLATNVHELFHDARHFVGAPCH